MMYLRGAITSERGFKPNCHEKMEGLMGVERSDSMIPDMTCLPQAGKRMGLMIMTILIKILHKFPKLWNRLWDGFGVDLIPLIKGEVGFRNIKKAKRKSTTESHSLFLPYRVLLNLSSSLFHLRFLPSLIG